MDEDRRSELDRFYRSTAYVVRAPGGDIVLRIDANSLDIDELMQDAGAGSWAFLTAWNPGSEPASPDDNARRQIHLLEALKSRDLKYLSGTTEDPAGEWDPEESVLVFGIEREAAVELARQYGQNAIVFGRLGEPTQLVWCE